MRIFCAAAMLALLAGPAFAQAKPTGMDAKEPDKPKSQMQIESETRCANET